MTRAIPFVFLIFIASFLNGCGVVKDPSGINRAVGARAAEEALVARVREYGQKETNQYKAAAQSYNQLQSSVNMWLDETASNVSLTQKLDVSAATFDTKFGPAIRDFETKAFAVPGVGGSADVGTLIGWIVEAWGAATQAEADRVAGLVRAARWRDFDTVLRDGPSPTTPPRKTN